MKESVEMVVNRLVSNVASNGAEPEIIEDKETVRVNNISDAGLKAENGSVNRENILLTSHVPTQGPHTVHSTEIPISPPRVILGDPEKES